MGLLKCLIYLALTGILSFLLGRILPSGWFQEDRFPYKCYAWENGGKIYRKLGIHKWQNKVPDMSKIFPKLMKKKKIERDYQKDLPVMIRETCIAELIHFLLCIAGLASILIWPGPGGIIVAILYILGNIPFILIQRYNRPRLLKLKARMK